jgi:hypothetical protein
MPTENEINIVHLAPGEGGSLYALSDDGGHRHVYVWNWGSREWVTLEQFSRTVVPDQAR